MKRWRFSKILILAGFMLWAGACRPAAQKAAPAVKAATGVKVRIGFMICDGIEETKSRFEPLVRYLARETGFDIEPVYLNTFEVPEAYERGDLDITHTNSLLYVIMHEEGGLLPLAGEKRGSMGFMSAGGIAVRADSPIKKVSDLTGKRMVFGPNLAPTGFLSQYELLLDAGVDPELDLEYYGIPWGAYKHEKVVYGVWMGAYDAAAVPMLDIENMLRDKKIAPEDLRILAVNDPIPYCVFGASPDLPADVAGKVRTLLLNLTGEAEASVAGEDLNVLKRALVDGFVPIADGDFDRVREMARKANMPPYQKF